MLMLILMLTLRWNNVKFKKKILVLRWIILIIRRFVETILYKVILFFIIK